MSHRTLVRRFGSAMALSVAVTASAAWSGHALATTPLEPQSSPQLGEARVDPPALERATLDALRETAKGLSQGRGVQVELIDLRAAPDSTASLALEGVGRLKIEQGEWIPLRFLAGYDLVECSLFGLRVQPIATATPSTKVAIEAGMGERVNDQIAARILAEFPDQPLEIIFVDLQPTSDSNSHVAFRGTGLVDFADEGAAPVSFNAILDRASGLVVAMDYSFEIAGAHGEAEFAESIAALR